MFSLRSSSAICLGRLKVKVTLDGQTIKWSYIELVPAISSNIFSAPLQSKGMLYPWGVRAYVLWRPHRVRGFLGSVFAFRSISAILGTWPTLSPR